MMLERDEQSTLRGYSVKLHHNSHVENPYWGTTMLTLALCQPMHKAAWTGDVTFL